MIFSGLKTEAERYSSIEILTEVSKTLGTSIQHLVVNLQDYIHKPIAVTVETLEMSAKLRFCFEFIVQLICQRYIKLKAFEKEVAMQQDAMFKQVTDFVTLVGNDTHAQLFILRNIIFDYGFEELKIVIQKSGLDLGFDTKKIEEVSYR